MPPKGRKYDSDYIKYGFTAIEVNKEIRPQCVICTAVLSNDALKPAKLERHLKTVHPNFSDRPTKRILCWKIRKLKENEIRQKWYSISSEKALSASFEVSLLIAKANKQHTIGESLINRV